MILFCGWKDIAKACGVKTCKTIKKRKRDTKCQLSTWMADLLSRKEHFQGGGMVY